MMKVRKFIIPAAALAAACIFSACSGSGATETTAAATEAAAETSAAESSEAAETTAAEEGAEAESSEAESSEGAQALDTDSLELITAISKVAPVKPEVLGEVSLGEYTGLDLTAPKAATVTDEEVDTYIETNILPSYPVEIVDGEVQEGDTATINFVGSIDGVEFPGGSGTDYPLVIGSGAFIPGFEEQLIGGHYGETINVNVTF
ncbi:MAG: FKBP-type peptidyl-prolyl cis-trans isomerase, partial [Lachnospiraceae bacterium]|nr:FKBP-type peptidyl-prolyl cis-trans isomerase [Lachnospiraceae bacterium]